MNIDLVYIFLCHYFKIPWVILVFVMSHFKCIGNLWSLMEGFLSIPSYCDYMIYSHILHLLFTLYSYLFLFLSHGFWFVGFIFFLILSLFSCVLYACQLLYFSSKVSFLTKKITYTTTMKVLAFILPLTILFFTLYLNDYLELSGFFIPFLKIYWIY